MEKESLKTLIPANKGWIIAHLSPLFGVEVNLLATSGEDYYPKTTLNQKRVVINTVPDQHCFIEISLNGNSPVFWQKYQNILETKF